MQINILNIKNEFFFFNKILFLYNIFFQLQLKHKLYSFFTILNIFNILSNQINYVNNDYYIHYNFKNMFIL